MGIPTLRTCHFEASEDIMTKFKLQALHTPQESNIEKLVGVAILHFSFLPNFLYQVSIKRAARLIET